MKKASVFQAEWRRLSTREAIHCPLRREEGCAGRFARQTFPSSVGKRLHSFSKLVQIDFQVLKERLRRTAKFSRIEIEGDMGIGSEKG